MSRDTVLPDKQADFSGWYNALVRKSGLVEEAPVRGCVIFKPYGFALWERIKTILDKAFKETGHQNAYFPLLIPTSYLSKEAAHVEGFAKECAVVTHYRLKNNEEGKIVVDPAAKLEDPLVVRPTSETIIWSTYSKWIQSYRDLPLLLNQWANVVRWEMRTRPFLRTTEFLWQEGHTAHATEQEAHAEARQMHDLYTDFMRDYLALPVIQGEKSETERFAGALNTYTMEAIMQDGKALQLGTSHFLGQNFAKAFNVRFSDKNGQLQYAWGSSWGVTTRQIGALILTHSDQKGLVLPPKIAPEQVVIIPILRKKGTDNEALLTKVEALNSALLKEGIRVKVDTNEAVSPGWKYTQYELQGIPIRLTLGPRDLEAGSVELMRRDTGEKHTLPLDNAVATVGEVLEKMQGDMLEKATSFQKTHTVEVDSYDAFKEVLNQKVPGFILAHWDGTAETEKKIQEETQATIRCIPFEGEVQAGTCVYSGKPSARRVLFAKAY